MLPAHLQPIGFIPTRHAEAARHFYETVLGLAFVKDNGFALVFQSGAVANPPGMLRVVRVPALTPQPFTVFGWETPDIATTCRELSERGVRFAQYGLPGQEPTGIWTAPDGDKVAWFTDPDGNTLSLSQHA